MFFLCSCEKKETDPKIITLEAKPNSAFSCRAIAQVDERGSYNITDHGFVYFYGSENSGSFYADNKISLGKELAKDTFAANFSLNSNYYYQTSYKWYVRAYITNEKGTVYGNTISFEPLVLSLQSISPGSAKIGDTISINGNNFDPIPVNNNVRFYNSNYFTAKVVSASKTLLKVIVPDFTSGYYYSGNYFDIVVTIGSQNYILNDVFSLATSVTSFYPSSGTFNTSITIYGTNFGQLSGIMLGNTLITSYSSSTNYVSIYVPSNMTSKKFKIYILKGSVKTEVPGGEFVMNSLVSTSFSPAKIYAGNTLTITGSNFNSSSSYNFVLFGSTRVSNIYSYTSYINVTVPSTLTAGDYTVSVSNGVDTVIIPGKLKVVVPSITGISPTSGYVGTDLTISGHNLNTNSYYVYFNTSIYSAYSYDTSTYKIKVPSLTPGTYKILLSGVTGQIQSPTDFTVLAPTLTSITPTNGTVGTAVIITGDGFGTSTSNVSVKFGSINASVSAVSNTQINATVPSGVVAGSWMVSVVVNSYTIAKSLTFSNP